MRKCSTCGTEFTGQVCPKCMASFMQKPTEVTKPDKDSPLRPGQTFHGLEVVELLGKGGMGVVYKARQPALNRFVALKLLPQDLAQDPEFQARFRREAQALATLSHPNIVSVYDFGAESNLFFFVMEFVNGVNLREILREKTLSPEEAFKIVPQLCDALEYAHGEGVVHRDIKPENILIDKKGRIKIADFGLAKLSGAAPGTMTLTGTDVAMGTPRYMAPEQFESTKGVDHRADIYSMGVVFYEMLTGEIPMGHFDPPSKKVHVDVRLDAVVLRTLEREPERRYQSAREVRTDVTQVTAVVDPNPSPPARSIPEEARKRPLLAIGGVLSLGLLLAVGLAYLLSLDIEPSENEMSAHIAGKESEEKPGGKAVTGGPDANPTFFAPVGLDQFHLVTTFQAHERGIWSLAFHPNGKTLVSSGVDNTLKLWDSTSGTERLTIRNPRTESMVFRPREGSLAVGCWDGHINVWNPGSGLQVRTLKGHSGHFTFIGFSKDGKSLVSGNHDKSLRIWEMETGQEIRTLSGHQGPVKSVAVSPTEDIVASGSGTGEVKIWDLATGHVLHDLAGPKIAWSLAFSPDGKNLASGGENVVKLWDVATGGQLYSFPTGRGMRGPMVFSPNGEVLLARVPSGLFAWRVKTGEKIYELPLERGITAINPQGTLLAIGRDDGSIELFANGGTTYAAAPRKPAVPADAKEFGGHKYKLFKDPLTWPEAKKRCEKLGGHLVTITSAGENAFVSGLTPAKEDVFIGLSDERNPGKWAWVTGEPVVFTNWHTEDGYPRVGKPHYAQISYYFERKWINVHLQKKPYICEWGPPVDFASPPRDARESGGHYYRRFVEEVTWKEAKRRCEEMGGHLVTITSEEEQQFVQGLLPEGKAWVGLTDDGREGTWTWVTGEPLAYTNWAQNQPDNRFGGQHFGMFQSRWKYTWDDDGWNIKHGFICEWEPFGQLNLLEMLDLERDTNGPWKIEEGIAKIHSGPVAYTMKLPHEPPEEYDLLIQAKRISERGGPLRLNLVSGSKWLAVELDAKSRSKGSYLMFGSGRDSDQNETHTDKGVLEKGKSNVIFVSVRKGALSVVLEGKTIIQWTGILDQVAQRDPKRIPSIGVTKSTWEFERIVLFPVSGRGVAVGPGSSSGRPAHVPADALEFSGHYYKLLDQGLMWHEAKRECEAMRGHLVTITSREENDFVKKLAAGPEYVAIGLEKSPEGWRWVTGERVSFTDWASGKPDESSERLNWAYLHGDSGMHWVDRPGDFRYPHVCEWDPVE